MYNGLSEQEELYVLNHLEETMALLMTIGKIPAPSYYELQRAKYCQSWLKRQGADHVFIDEVNNVICPIGCVDQGPLVVIMAHSDIAFQDTEEMNIVQKGHKFFGAGIGDDTANVVHLLMTIKYILKNKLKPSSGILFVIDACEEGLGNSRGCQAIIDKYQERIVEFISFDGYLNECTNSAVGSQRYQITVHCEGGHSYADFGKDNAIFWLSELICRLNAIKVPTKQKTTYNFGQIEGGTSINTIASRASLFYEFRSSDQACLEIMETQLRYIVQDFIDKGLHIDIETIGIRPGNGSVDQKKLLSFTNRNVNIINRYYHEPVRICAHSTDANIPLSRGICANTIGTIMGGNAHTYHEWIDIQSIPIGLKVAMAIVLQYFYKSE